jgi:hypothetical protein
MLAKADATLPLEQPEPPRKPRLVPVEIQPEPPAEPVNDGSRDFSWADTEHVVLRCQPQTAVYLNPHDEVVIRQEAWPDEDVWVRIHRTNLWPLIARLQEIDKNGR